METDSRDAISIKLERTLSIGRPKVENIDTRTEVSRLSLDRVLLGRECSHPETKPPIVTNNRNIQSSPYNLKVTGKWTVRNRTRGLPTLDAILWFCSLIFLLCANIYYFRKLHHRYEECLQTVSQLENTVEHMAREAGYLRTELHDMAKRLDQQTRYPRKELDSFSHNYVPPVKTISLEAAQQIDSGLELRRVKRANDEVPSGRKDRKKKTVAVQFSGSKPYGFSMVPPEGILGPWIESSNDFSNVEKFGAKLRDHNSTLEVNRGGMYMIYAQVTYQSINVSNSYSINVIPNTDRLRAQSITTCSSFGKIVRDGEISCYTSVVKPLNAGDIIFVQQAQPDREIIFAKTYTFFGLIFLN